MLDKTFLHYKILSKLGEGGMGVVYKAHDTRLKREVAIKFLPRHISRDSEERERFKIEAQAAASLNHPNIAMIHSIEEVDDEMFIVMEYIDGRELAEEIASNLPNVLKLRKVLEYATQIAAGLRAAHDKGIVHRDIKSSNIMITKDGQIKIMDFGLAKVHSAAKLTKENTTLGTTAYMSPEQALGNDIDHRTDIWSFGVVLYEMITGQLPFKGEYEHAVVYSILNLDPEPMTGLMTDSPKELTRITSEALTKNVMERYQHVDEILTELMNLKTEIETAPKLPISKIADREHKRKSFNRIILPAAIIILLAILFFVFKHSFFGRTKISEPIPIAVISFENQTGDKTLDYLQKAIPDLLVTSLEQSNYFNVTTRQRMFDLLKQIGNDSVEIIDEDLGFELCSIEGVNTIVLGSFIKAGEQFATDVKVLDVESKRLLKSASSRGKGIGSILETQIDELSRDIAQGVGLSERAIDVTQKPVAEVTTNSMEAYQYYIEGITELGHLNPEDAGVLLEKAIQLDSTFAIAHWYLGLAYYWLRNQKGANEAFEKARGLSYKAPNKERLLINAYYTWGIEKNREKAVSILHQIVKKYPKEKFSHLWLGYDYLVKKRYAEAIAEYNKALKLDPQFGMAYEHLSITYVRLGKYNKAIENLNLYAAAAPGNALSYDLLGDLYFKIGYFDDAITNYRKALKIKPEFRSNWKIAYIYAVKEDYAEAMKWINNYVNIARSTGPMGEGLWWKAFYHSWLGKLDQSLRELKKLEDLAEKVENFDALDWVHWTLGWVYLELGDYKSSRKAFNKMYDIRLQYSSWKFTHKIMYNFFTGLIDLKEGKHDSIKLKLIEIKSLLPKAQLEVPAQVYNDGILYDYNILSTEVLLAQGSLEEAMDLWNKTTIPPPQMDFGNLGSYNMPFLKDYSARIYIKMGNIDKAIAEYERLVTFNPNRKDWFLKHPKYHYRLAKLYEEKGVTKKAITEYKKFLDIWKDADEDLPALIDARARYAKLKEVR